LLKARSRKISLVLVLAMLMTMFAGLGAASAASIEYKGVNVPVVQTKADAPDIKVLIDVSDAVVFADAYSRVTMQLPSNVELDTDSASLTTDVTVDVAGGDAAKAMGNVNISATIKSSRAVDIVVDAAGIDATTLNGDVRLLLTIRDMYVKSGSGDIVANFIAPSGSPFPNGAVTIAKIAGSGKVTVLGGTVKNIGDAVAEIDTITLAENTAGVFKKGEVIELELSKGFKWVTEPTVVGGWAFEGLSSANGAFSVEIDKQNPRILEITINHGLGFSTAGRISIGTDLLTDLTGYTFAEIEAEDDAKYGDVTVTVESDKDSVSKTKIVVAKYGSYEVKVTEGTTEEVLAGRTEQEIGEFYIEEAIAGSLIEGRTIIFELPSGVKWVTPPTIDVEDGDVKIGSFVAVTGSKDRAIKATVTGASAEASKVLFKDAEVKVDPGFEGDIVVTVEGTAGVEGSVKVAEAKLPVTITAENPTKIVTGAPNQKVADIIIKETVAEAILDTKANDGNMIVVGLDDGYKFSSKPTVEVTEGDLEIDSTKLINNDTELRILIKYSSNEPSTITISDVYVTAYRYVPEGDVKATLVAVADYGTSDATGSTALVDFDTDKSAGSAVIATCVTPAEAAAVGEFRIGSNVYYLNGIAKVMDVAPYIKNSRTYVPMRYVGEMLGAEVVWDDAARTVTLTKGDTTVVFTIGSTTYTVNGEAKTADVAPEIANDRTMLPARFVAEAFGATVGWDATTQTVLIQQ